MNTPLDRLYKTKLALLAVLLMVSGVSLLFLPLLLANVPAWPQVLSTLVSELGSALFIGGLFSVAVYYIDREDAEERAMHRLRTIFKEQAPALRDSMLDTFATDAETLKKVASEATLDGIVRNSLAIQLGDARLANDLYDDVRQQVIRSGERWRDVQVSVSLAQWAEGPTNGSGTLFEATIRWEYRTTLHGSLQRFSCVSDLDEYRQLLEDPTSTLAWYFEPVGDQTAASPEVFELIQFSVGGKVCAMRRGKRARSQTFVVDTKDFVGHDTTVSYTYRVLVQRHSHVLQLDIAKPSKGLKVQFSYGGCGIRHVNVLDFIASSEQPRIDRPAIKDGQPVATIGFDGWVWPKSGAAFVWVLGDELAKPRSVRRPPLG
jgi:hypothetical protein